MENHEVAVIGLGTAGLSACRTLDELGVDYIGIDGKKEIGKPIRSTAGIAYRFIDKYGMPKGNDVVAHQIRSMRLAHESGESVTLNFDSPVGAIYDFTKYEQAILKDKSRLIMDTPVLSIDGDVIHTNKENIKAKRIIVATGPVSNLRPMSPEYNLTPEDTIAGYEETRHIKTPEKDDVILYFSEKYAPGGYLWNFADSGDKRRIGLGVRKDAKLNPKTSLAEFSKLHPELEGEIDHTIAHLLALPKPPTKVVFGNRMYVGEAARTTFASDGAGLQMAFGSGQEAAKAWHNPNQYQRVWSHEIRPLLMTHYKLKMLLYSLSSKEFSNVIKSLKEFEPSTLDPAKELPKAAFFCMSKNPRLIPRLIKFLI